MDQLQHVRDLTLSVVELEGSYCQAARALEAALQQLHPKGTEVEVHLSCRQRRGTLATILCTCQPGYYRVRLDKPNRWGRQHIATVHYTQVFRRTYA